MSPAFDEDIVLAKVSNVRRCVATIRSIHGPAGSALPDWVVLDLTVLNLQRAVEAGRRGSDRRASPRRLRGLLLGRPRRCSSVTPRNAPRRERASGAFQRIPVPRKTRPYNSRVASVRDEFEGLLTRLAEEARAFYGGRLVSLVVFGSVGRGTMRADSDIDLLVVADPLPDGRIPRVREFDGLEARLAKDLARARGAGVETRLSPVFKTPEEARGGSPLFLDMLDDARLLEDRGDFFARVLSALRGRLSRQGARRVWRGNAWYWDLKPDYRPGDVVEL